MTLDEAPSDGAVAFEEIEPTDPAGEPSGPLQDCPLPSHGHGWVALTCAVLSKDDAAFYRALLILLRRKQSHLTVGGRRDALYCLG